MAKASITVRNQSDAHRLEGVLEDGTVAGFVDYRPQDDTVYDFTHTEVADEQEGQGIGGQLARGVMDFARSNGLRIVPSCKFLRSYMREHEETHDLLADGASLE
jgi:uncharacterized protein